MNCLFLFFSLTIIYIIGDFRRDETTKSFPVLFADETSLSRAAWTSPRPLVTVVMHDVAKKRKHMLKMACRARVLRSK